MRRAVIALILAGCGRIDFEARSGDGGPGDGVVPADTRAPACAQFGPWGNRTKLPPALQTSDDDWGGTPSDGDRLFYLYQCRSSGCDVFFSKRASASDAFGAPVIDSALSTASVNEVAPTLTGDGLFVIYASEATASFKLMQAERASTSASFGAPIMVPNVGSPGQERDPFLSADGRRLVFTSTRAGGARLFEATRASRADTFGAPVELASLDTTGAQISPALSSDGLEILFASNRAGGSGAYDVYRSTRPALDQPFAAPALVPELSTTMDDLDIRISEDGTLVYINWMTDINGFQNTDLYTFSRSCL